MSKQIPAGYDAICKTCQCPFVFHNSKRSFEDAWRDYCCKSCFNNRNRVRISQSKLMGIANKVIYDGNLGTMHIFYILQELMEEIGVEIKEGT